MSTEECANSAERAAQWGLTTNKAFGCAEFESGSDTYRLPFFRPKISLTTLINKV